MQYYCPKCYSKHVPDCVSNKSLPFEVAPDDLEEGVILCEYCERKCIPFDAETAKGTDAFLTTGAVSLTPRLLANLIAAELLEERPPSQTEPVDEPEKPLILRDGLSPMQLGRLNKCLSKVYHFDIGIMSLERWLNRNAETITHRSQYTRTHASKKRNMCYKELATPKTEYTVWKGSTGIDIPKVVYDCLTVDEK